MKSNNAILHLTVGEPIEASLNRAAAAMKAAKQGKRAKPYFGKFLRCLRPSVGS